MLSELPLAVVRVTAPLGVGVPFDAAKVVPDFCEGVGVLPILLVVGLRDVVVVVFPPELLVVGLCDPVVVVVLDRGSLRR